MDIRVYRSDMAGYSFNASTGFAIGPGTDSWEEMDRPFEFKVHRSTGAQPGSIEIVMPGVNASKDSPPLWPFQRIQVKDVDPNITDQDFGRIFIGRVDSIAPRQDAKYGRVWVVKARDYLAALVDNYVDIGRNRAFDDDGSPLSGHDGSNRPIWVPKWVEKVQMETQKSPLPVAACTDGEHCGTSREYMIAELALNVVPLPFGLASMTALGESFPPNSLPVQYNYENIRSMRILDAIINMAREDPWNPDIDLVDSKTATGIGGEFQLRYTSPEDEAWMGQHGQYFKRGGNPWDGAIEFIYGEAGKGIIPIIGYDFPQEGNAIFSRAKVIGRGDAQDLDPDVNNPGSWGTGFVSDNPQLEGIWNPELGQFAIMRGMDEQESAIIGDWHIDPAETGVDGSNPLAVRGLRDRAASKMITYTGDLTRGNRRGLRGMIRVPGYPRRTIDMGSLIVGYVIDVKIPPALGDDVLPFVVESWSFKYPENVTTIQLAANSSSSLLQVMGGWERRMDQGGASHGEWITSNWRPTSGSGNELFVHTMGVIPRTVIVEAAVQDGNKEDRNGDPVPIEWAIVEVPRLASEPAQGQIFGYVVHKSDTMDFEFGLAYWIADSSGRGDWLKDGEAIYRVRLRA